MKKITIILILISLVMFGCAKKPQPSPEEIIPEIPEPVTAEKENSDNDLTDIMIPVNDGSVEAIEVIDDEALAGENELDGAIASIEDSTAVVSDAAYDKVEEEVIVETQVVIDPVQDLDEIVPDSIWTEYMIKPGQTLSLIAYEEYGNPNEWRSIYGWNKEKIGDDPNMIHPYHYLDLLKPSENSVEFEPDYYIHKVTRGETLWTISKKEYGDQYAWVVLYWDNEALLQENDGILRPGMELKVRTELWPEF